MGNKVIIDGKEYTERNVEFMNINGEKIESNIISAETANKESVLNVTIKLKEDKVESEIQSENKLNIDSIKSLESTKNEIEKSWVQKIWDSIKSLFKKE